MNTDESAATRMPKVIGTAKDGAEALELARSLKPDVITLDVRMPRMDGIEASSRIMSEAPSRILVISGAVDAEMSFKALQAGALEVMPKPRPGLEGLANFGVKLIHIIRTMAELPLAERRQAPVQPPAPPVDKIPVQPIPVQPIPPQPKALPRPMVKPLPAPVNPLPAELPGKVIGEAVPLPEPVPAPQPKPQDK